MYLAVKLESRYTYMYTRAKLCLHSLHAHYLNPYACLLVTLEGCS